MATGAARHDLPAPAAAGHFAAHTASPARRHTPAAPARSTRWPPPASPQAWWIVTSSLPPSRPSPAPSPSSTASRAPLDSAGSHVQALRRVRCCLQSQPGLRTAVPCPRCAAPAPRAAACRLPDGTNAVLWIAVCFDPASPNNPTPKDCAFGLATATGWLACLPAASSRVASPALPPPLLKVASRCCRYQAPAA